eukprot:997757-Rhodomonas_salina.2
MQGRSNSTRIGAVWLYDCMPRTATPILRSTTPTAQAQVRNQCQCPFSCFKSGQPYHVTRFN